MILCSCAVAVLIGLVLAPVYYRSAWLRDYRPAEELVPSIWALADEMKRFHDEHGRSAFSLEEISRVALDQDFSSLRAYTHEFTPSGPQRFYLRVNGSYAFEIDAAFAPHWAHPDRLVPSPVSR